MNRSPRLVALVALLLLSSTITACGGGAVAASPESSDCPIGWDALPEEHLVSTYTTATIEDLQAAGDVCFDRLVVDLGPAQAGLPGPQGVGYQVKYVAEARNGAGEPLPVLGDAFLAVVLNAPAHDGDFQPTYQPRDPIQAVDVAGFQTFRQVAFLGTFESQTEVVIGVRARLPFRAFVLAGPQASRLVIDVAHRE
jgi:hypothetical protein